MRIGFLLPPAPPHPVGGCKIVYRYANELAARGHQVELIHSMSFSSDNSLWRLLRIGAATCLDLLRFRNKIRWFDLDPRVRFRIVPKPFSSLLPEMDRFVATAYSTAEWVADSEPGRRGQGYYLIQHLEDWEISREAALATWRLPIRAMVISTWLKEIAEEIGVEVDLAPNGLDLEEFGVDVPITSREPGRVGMLWHDLPWKGSLLGLAALEDLKGRYPNLRGEVFGVVPRPGILPDWIDYHQQPSRASLRSLYNRCSIFVCPSLLEGWGLPSSEAMQCGCALVTADNGGSRDFAQNDVTALVCQPGSASALAEGIESLLADSEKRIRIAAEGNRRIRVFDWERATLRLCEILGIGSTNDEPNPSAHPGSTRA